MSYYYVLTATQGSLSSKPYANQTVALSVRKNDKESGMNSTLRVLTT